MAKMPPFSPFRYGQNKRSERLYFPQSGDTHLFQECGKKHFKIQSSLKTPYAFYQQSAIEDPTHNRSQYYNKNSTRTITPTFQHHSPKIVSKINQNYLNYQEENQINHREALEQQMFHFEALRFNKEKLNSQRDNRRRFHTESQIQNYHKKREDIKQVSSRQVKRQEFEDLSERKYHNRFNPTFLSSINY